MNVVVLVCLLGTLFFSELIYHRLWKNTEDLKILLFRLGVTYILSIVTYVISYIGANYVMLKWDNTISLNSVRLAIYVGVLTDFLCMILRHRQQIRDILKTESKQKYILSIILIICSVIVTELTVFNFRHFQSVFFNPIYIDSFCTSPNLVQCDVNTYELVDTGDTYIEIIDINEMVNNVYADYTFPLLGEYAVKGVNYHFSARDQGNAAYYYDLPIRIFYHLIPQSQYTHVNLYGKCYDLQINFDNLEVGDVIHVQSLVLNARVPFMISIKRSLFLIFWAIVLFLMRPSSSLWKIKYTDSFRRRKIYIFAFVIIQLAFFWNVVNLNPFFKNTTDYSGTQYQHLAEAFREGYPYLGLEVPKGVTELEDPYDGSMRDQVLEEGEWVLHDVGYYAGHYYVYFGVGPVIVFFLPYLLITGNQLPTYIAMYLTALIAVLAIMGLLSQLIKKWFTQTPFLLYLMFSCLFINGSGLLFAMQRPDFYSLPIIMALAASVSGLYFWFASVEHGFITKWKMIMGSLCMAFVAACRPQFLLGSFFAIIIFWKTTVKNRELFSKKGLLNTISFLLPYVLIAGGVMYYNYIRFGSVFDFGANYNLTYNNMPLRGWRLDRLIYAIVGFGFYPMSVTNTFPFLGQCHYSTAYQGLYVDESLMGGAVANNLYLISTLFIFRLKKYFKNMTSFLICVFALVFSVVIMVTDAMMAGFTTRYITDFTWLLMISSFIIIATIFDTLEQKGLEIGIKTAMYWLFIITMTGRLLSIFTDVGLSLRDMNSLYFQKIAHLVEFWN